jgi:hypothetical protein
MDRTQATAQKFCVRWGLVTAAGRWPCSGSRLCNFRLRNPHSLSRPGHAHGFAPSVVLNLQHCQQTRWSDGEGNLRDPSRRRANPSFRTRPYRWDQMFAFGPRATALGRSDYAVTSARARQTPGGWLRLRRGSSIDPTLELSPHNAVALA